MLDLHLAELAKSDARLVPVLAASGEVPLRLRPGGFAGLARIVVSQLLSVASANAISARLDAAVGDLNAARFLAVPEADIRRAGLSGGKYATLKRLAEAELAGDIDYEALADLPAETALAALTAHKGIGVWTGEIYLLFCTGHPDIFPAGDLALRKMVGRVLGDDDLPTEKQVRAASTAWSPYRGAAARLMWRYFAVLKQREGIGV